MCAYAREFEQGAIGQWRIPRARERSGLSDDQRALWQCYHGANA